MQHGSRLTFPHKTDRYQDCDTALPPAADQTATLERNASPFCHRERSEAVSCKVCTDDEVASLRSQRPGASHDWWVLSQRCLNPPRPGQHGAIFAAPPDDLNTQR
jgi:hypothetical protein